jgi:hypothetical protein
MMRKGLLGLSALRGLGIAATAVAMVAGTQAIAFQSRPLSQATFAGRWAVNEPCSRAMSYLANGRVREASGRDGGYWSFEDSENTLVTTVGPGGIMRVMHPNADGSYSTEAVDMSGESVGMGRETWRRCPAAAARATRRTGRR